MSFATPALDALRDTLPDDLKDIRLNVGAVLGGETLAPAQALGVALAAARFLRHRPLAEAIESCASPHHHLLPPSSLPAGPAFGIFVQIEEVGGQVRAC